MQREEKLRSLVEKSSCAHIGHKLNGAIKATYQTRHCKQKNIAEIIKVIAVEK